MTISRMDVMELSKGDFNEPHAIGASMDKLYGSINFEIGYSPV